ncbi:MAG: pyrroline-5-carboxylate reductase [Paludibacteraceae bacterium]|nr:pyrroline-5-carboxylate reductase [Paludibacteraceae bacterium]
MQIAIIGAGNIGGAVASGLLRSKSIGPSDLLVADIEQSNLDAIKKIDSKVTVSNKNKEVAAKADIIILAVKPWLVQPVLSDLSGVISPDKVLVCIAAGIDFEFLSHIIDGQISMFRVMPNTAISLNESMTLISSQNATKAQEEYVLNLFAQLGKSVLIPESMMGPATSVASCGIAYALRYLRAAVEGAVELGFRADVATEIVAQTMKGAVELVLQNGSHPEVEIDKVTTPGGWTIKGLNEMEAHGFTNAVIKGLKANN